jgi:uncharacterized integral membrane protein
VAVDTHGGASHVRVAFMGRRSREPLILFVCVVIVAGFVLVASLLTAHVLRVLLGHI